MSQRFKRHLDRVKCKFVLLSLFVWSSINLSQMLCLYLHCLDTCEPRGWKYLFLLAMDNRVYPWANGLLAEYKDRDWRWINTDDNTSWAPALWPVTLRHKPTTQKMTVRSWLGLFSRSVAQISELSFRSVLYAANHKPVPSEMAESTVLRSGLWGDLL